MLCPAGGISWTDQLVHWLPEIFEKKFQVKSYTPPVQKVFVKFLLTGRFSLATWLREKKKLLGKTKKNYSNQYSHVVPHHSTDWSRCCLTAEIGRDPVLSTLYGRSSKFIFNSLLWMLFYLKETYGVLLFFFPLEIWFFRRRPGFFPVTWVSPAGGNFFLSKNLKLTISTSAAWGTAKRVYIGTTPSQDHVICR